MNKLVLSDYKILDTVFELNKHDYFPLSDGVYKILKGVVDEETVQYINYPTFSTLISCKSKKISMSIMLLVRYGYLGKIFDKKTEELYLQITELGKSTLVDFHKKHKVKYIKKSKDFKATIIKING